MQIHKSGLVLAALYFLSGSIVYAKTPQDSPITTETLAREVSEANTLKASKLFSGIKKLRFFYSGPPEHEEHIKFKLSKCGAEVIPYANSLQTPRVLLFSSPLPNIAKQYSVELKVYQMCKLANPTNQTASAMFQASTYELSEYAPESKIPEAMDKLIDKFVIDFLKANRGKPKDD